MRRRPRPDQGFGGVARCGEVIHAHIGQSAFFIIFCALHQRKGARQLVEHVQAVDGGEEDQPPGLNHGQHIQKAARMGVYISFGIEQNLQPMPFGRYLNPLDDFGIEGVVQVGQHSHDKPVAQICGGLGAWIGQVSMAALTFSTVVGRTLDGSLSTRETVAMDTPAMAAT